MNHFLLLALAFLLVLLNAFFVAAEFGMVKLRHTRVQAIQSLYGMRGKILAQVHKKLDAYLSACQLGITLASLGLGWVGEPAFAHLLMPLFEILNITSAETSQLIALAVAFFIISFLHIVIGELMPKSLAIRQSEAVSIWTAIPLYLFYWLMYPAIWLLNSCSNILLKITGLGKIHNEENYHSTEEIKLILSSSHLHGELTQKETAIITHTLDFADLQVVEMMRPHQEMTMLDIQQPVDRLLKAALQQRYSRYPVYSKNSKKIIGLIHIKDLFALAYEKSANKNIHTIIRPICTISHHLPALDLLDQFRQGIAHFALVKNARGSIIGFITLDNLLHVLLGRMTDEFHKTKDDWVRNADGTLQVKGECAIYALEKALEQKITTGEEEVETLAGLILHQLGTLPKVGQRIQFADFETVVEKVIGAKIQLVRVIPQVNKEA